MPQVTWRYCGHFSPLTQDANPAEGWISEAEARERFHVPAASVLMTRYELCGPGADMKVGTLTLDYSLDGTGRFSVWRSKYAKDAVPDVFEGIGEYALRPRGDGYVKRGAIPAGAFDPAEFVVDRPEWGHWETLFFEDPPWRRLAFA